MVSLNLCSSALVTERFRVVSSKKFPLLLRWDRKDCTVVFLVAAVAAASTEARKVASLVLGVVVGESSIISSCSVLMRAAPPGAVSFTFLVVAGVGGAGALTAVAYGARTAVWGVGGLDVTEVTTVCNDGGGVVI